MAEKKIDREVKCRLAIFNHADEITRNVAMTCRSPVRAGQERPCLRAGAFCRFW
jgi:hypothetical protein